MNTINKVLIAVLVAQLGLMALTLGRGSSTGMAKEEPVIPGFDAAWVERIEIYNAPPSDAAAATDAAAHTPAVELGKQGSGWVVRSHFDYPAQDSKVSELLGKLAGMSTRGPIATSEGRQSQLDVSDSDYSRKLVLHGKSGEPITLYVGSPAGARKTAVRLGGSKEIYGVTDMSSGSASTVVTSWVEPTLVSVTAAEVASITVKNGAGEFTFERLPEGGFALAAAAGEVPAAGMAVAGAPAQPPQPVDTATIDALVQAASSVRMIKPGNPAEATGQPLATVTLRMKEPAPPAGEEVAMSPVREEHVLEIVAETKGDAAGNYLVRVPGSSHVAEVAKSSLEKLVSFDKSAMQGTAAKPAAPAVKPAAPATKPAAPAVKPAAPAAKPAAPATKPAVPATKPAAPATKPAAPAVKPAAPAVKPAAPAVKPAAPAR